MDTLISALVFDNEAKVTICNTTDITNYAIKRHDLSPTPSAALGRALAGAVMMTCDLKNEDDCLTVTIKGNGDAGSIVVSGEFGGNVRGYIDNPHAEAPIKANGKLNVSGIVGESGEVTVVKSDGTNPPYVGISPIVSGEIAEDLTYYYSVSEQKNTAISLGVLVDKNVGCVSGGGFTVHVLPFARQSTIDSLAHIIENMPPISSLLRDKTCEQILREYFQKDAKITFVGAPKFKCKCNRAGVEKIVASIPESERESIRKEHGKIEVVCHFCSKKYEF